MFFGWGESEHRIWSKMSQFLVFHLTGHKWRGYRKKGLCANEIYFDCKIKRLTVYFILIVTKLLVVITVFIGY